ncbi:MAG: hypothetical protein ACOY3D_03015, partial [Candidatus Omnitrophota bacterium]
LYVNELLEENQGLKTERDTLQRRITELEAAKSIPVAAKPLKEAQNTALKKEIETLKQQKRSLEEELKTLRKQSAIWDKEHAAHRENTADKIRQLEKLLKDCGLSSEDTEASLRIARQKILEQEKEIAGLKKLKASWDEQSVQKLRKELATSRAEVERLKNELSGTQKAIGELKAEKAQKEREIANLRNDNSRLVKQQEISESLLKLQPGPSIPHPALAEAAPPPDYELLAYNLAKDGNYAEAIAEYKKALAAEGPNKNIYFNLGLLYGKLKLYSDAADNYLKVLELDAADRDSLLSLSKTYERLADPAKASYYLNQYLKTERETKEVR